jgi:hypothetical protein
LSSLRIAFVPTLMLLAGCRQDMHNQPKIKPLQHSSVFTDGRSARPLVEGTVARGLLRDDTEYFEGRRAAALPSGSTELYQNLVAEFPMPVTRQMLERGRERFNMFCIPCHDYKGTGRGMIVQRGFSPPPSFHIERLKTAPAGHFFDVITNGYGRMYSYSQRVPVSDRWAIIAYVRALQLSQGATINEVPLDQRGNMTAPGVAQ